MTVDELHRLIQITTGLSDAAQKLGVSPFTLQKYCGPIVCNNKPLFYSYDDWKNLSVEAAQKKFGEEYSATIKHNKAKLNTYPLKTIHKVISKSESITAAEKRFGLHATLEAFLKDRYYQGNPLTFESFKNLHTDQISEVEYRSFVPLPEYKWTVASIHHAVRTNTTMTNVAQNLNVSYPSLQRCLGPIICKNKTLYYSFDDWKKLSEEDARKKFGDDYDASIKYNKAELNTYPLTTIHEVIFKSRTIAEAAGRFGIEPRKLKRYLSSINYGGNPLTFEGFKNLPTDQISNLAHSDSLPKNRNAMNYLPRPVDLGTQQIEPTAAMQEDRSTNPLPLVPWLNEILFTSTSNEPTAATEEECSNNPAPSDPGQNEASAKRRVGNAPIEYPPSKYSKLNFFQPRNETGNDNNVSLELGKKS